MLCPSPPILATTSSETPAVILLGLPVGTSRAEVLKLLSFPKNFSYRELSPPPPIPTRTCVFLLNLKQQRMSYAQLNPHELEKFPYSEILQTTSDAKPKIVVLGQLGDFPQFPVLFVLNKYLGEKQQ